MPRKHRSAAKQHCKYFITKNVNLFNDGSLMGKGWFNTSIDAESFSTNN